MKKIILAALFLFLIAGVYGVGYSEDGSGFATFGGTRMCMSDGSVPLTGTWDFSNVTVTGLNSIADIVDVIPNDFQDLKEKIEYCDSNGCKVWVPSGTYWANETIYANNWNVEGTGVTTQIRALSGFTGDSIFETLDKNSYHSNAIIRDIKINCDYRTDYGIYLNYTEESSLENTHTEKCNKAGLFLEARMWFTEVRNHKSYNNTYGAIIGGNQIEFFGGTFRDANGINITSGNTYVFYGTSLEEWPLNGKNGTAIQVPEDNEGATVSVFGIRCEGWNVCINNSANSPVTALGNHYITNNYDHIGAKVLIDENRVFPQKLSYGETDTTVISSGKINFTKSIITLTSENGTTDVLNNIGEGIEGDVLYLYPAFGHSITIEHNNGTNGEKIYLRELTDITLTSHLIPLVLIHKADYWTSQSYYN